MRMHKLAVVLAVASVGVVARQQPPGQWIENTVQVHADGKFQAAPDTAVITLSLSDKEATQDAAYRNVSVAAEQLRTILRQNNIDPKQAQVSSYAISPEYDWKNPKNRKPIAFTVQTTATLKMKGFNAANKLLVALSELQYASNQSLNYTLEDIDIAKKNAITDAYKNAVGYAEALAGESGRRVGDLMYASVDTQESVRPMPMMARAHEMKRTDAATPAPTEDMGQ